MPKRPDDPAEHVNGYSFCDGCNQIPRCGIVYRRVGSTVTHVSSRRDYGYPTNTLCAKGYAQLQELYHPDRIAYPLRRTNPKGEPTKWERMSWDEALGLTAERLKAVGSEFGADKVLFMTGDPKEMRSPLQRLAYTFGSPNYGTESSTCYTSVAIASRLLFGRPITGNPPGTDTKHCFIWGANPAYSRPVLMKKLIRSKDRGVRFFVVDPRTTPTVKSLEADHLALRPGTDGALALGMLNVIISEGLFVEAYVERWVHGFTELATYCREFDPETTGTITGVPPEAIRQAARAFADGPTTLMLSASPVVHHTNGNQNIRAVLTLPAVTSNLDRPGGVSIPEPPALPPDYVGDPVFCRRNDLLPDIKHLRADLEHYPVWAELVPEIQINLLPEYVDEGKIKAMVMFGGNAKMWPQPHLYQKAMAKLDFAVAADYFYRPWTHDYVDVLLPAATCLERQASVACFGRSIYVREPIAPREEAREDWRIIADLGVALGYSDDFFGGDLEALINEYLNPAGVTLSEIRNAPGCMVSVPEKGSQSHHKHEKGLLRTDGAPGFETPTGKVEVLSTVLEKHGYDPLPIYREPAESPATRPGTVDNYPLILMTGARVPYYTHTKWREARWLNEFQQEPLVNLHPSDANDRKISENDPVIIENQHGRVEMRAHITETASRGVADVQHGWADQDANELIHREFDPISGFPAYKEGLCQVSKSAER
jgi:anaerobic selenocysteine-containing dehydrogenase